MGLGLTHSNSLTYVYTHNHVYICLQGGLIRDFDHKFDNLRVVNIVNDTSKKFNISTSTLYRWRQQFFKYNKFLPDTRTNIVQGFIMRHEDLSLDLERFLLSSVGKDLTVDTTRDFINNKLLKDFPVGKIDKSTTLRRPVSYETVHQWMKLLGCNYDEVKKNYYVDTHERHDNQVTHFLILHSSHYFFMC